MKYARKDAGGHWFDVHVVPSSLYADLSDIEKKTGVTGYVEVDDGIENGAIDNGDGTYENPVKSLPPLLPIALSKTSFNKYAAAQLGGYAVFQAMLDACKTATDGNVRFCSTQYDSALTFEKSEVDAFTQIMVAASILTADQRAAILGNWPEA